MFFEVAHKDSKSNFMEYTIDFELVHIANNSSLEFAFLVKNSIFIDIRGLVAWTIHFFKYNK